jgi:UDP-perosamine 4-acetyltransferase
MIVASPCRVVVIGAGGHAKVVIEAIRACGGEVIGQIDPHPPAAHMLGAPVLGGDEALNELRAKGFSSLVVALGDNALRERLGRSIQKQGFALPAVVVGAGSTQRVAGCRRDDHGARW